MCPVSWQLKHLASAWISLPLLAFTPVWVLVWLRPPVMVVLFYEGRKIVYATILGVQFAAEDDKSILLQYFF